MKNIILIIPENPFKLLSGGQVCDYSVIKTLSKYFTIHLFTCSKVNHNMTNIFTYELKRTFYRINTILGFIQFFIQLFSDIVPRSSRIISNKYNKNMIQKVSEDNDIHFIFISHFEAIYLVKDLNKRISILHHNWESRLNLSHIHGTLNLFKKIFYFIDFLKFCYIEKKFINSTYNHLTLSTEESFNFSKHFNINSSLFPISINESPLAPTSNESDFIYIYGSWDWLPNRHGLLKIMSYLQNVNVPVKIKLSGYCSDKNFINDLNKLQSIQYLGFIDDSEVTFNLQNSLITLIPVFYGSGIKIKLLQALECSACILTTQSSITGLPEHSKLLNSVEIFNDNDDFQTKFFSLLNYPSLRLSKRLASFEYIKYYRSLTCNIFENLD